MAMKSEHIVPFHTGITKEDRWKLNGHRSCALWFTGLSAAGKSTVSAAVEKELHQCRVRSYVLDGDNIRLGLNANLGFSPEDRKENIRRIREVAKLFVEAGLFVLAASISPYREDRDLVRARFGKDEFIEIYVKCPLDECERRDPKGLYQQARNGSLSDFTGISAPYEEPVNPEIVIETDKQSVAQSATQIMSYLRLHNYIQA